MTDNHDMIAAGRAAWERLRQEGRRSWDDWVLVAKALAAGRSKAMQKAKCNKPGSARPMSVSSARGFGNMISPTWTIRHATAHWSASNTLSPSRHGERH